METLKGKIALVSGAAGVLGLATTKAMLEDGLKVIMVDLDQKKMESLAGQLKGEVYPIAFDISDFEKASQGYEKACKEFGHADVLVNNAGILSNNKVQDTPPEEWKKVMSVNIDGAFYLCKLVLGHMKEQKWGRIVNTCSFAAKSGGVTAGTAYTTSKGAMQSLTFSVARETTSFGVTVNGISPAYVNTPMVTEQLTEEQRQKLLAQIPVGRFCEPEEFAHVVRFLVSPMAGFITGEIVDLNGGLLFD